MKKLLIYCLMFIVAAILPYTCIALITWNFNIANWGWIGRLCFILWTLAISNITYNKLKKEKIL